MHTGRRYWDSRPKSVHEMCDSTYLLSHPVLLQFLPHTSLFGIQIQHALDLATLVIGVCWCGMLTIAIPWET